jgi:hypothetical protein
MGERGATMCEPDMRVALQTVCYQAVVHCSDMQGPGAERAAANAVLQGATGRGMPLEATGDGIVQVPLRLDRIGAKTLVPRVRRTVGCCVQASTGAVGQGPPDRADGETALDDPRGRRQSSPRQLHGQPDRASCGRRLSRFRSRLASDWVSDAADETAALTRRRARGAPTCEQPYLRSDLKAARSSWQKS